jgi:cyanase
MTIAAPQDIQVASGCKAHLVVVFFSCVQKSTAGRPVMSPCPNFDAFVPPKEKGSRGTGTPMPPTDPLIYRFYEMVMVNGPAWKALIEEEFGDGIMSAIDFDFLMERVANPKGDRVKITMSGKFLPYKYYGASGNVPEYGFKEG